MIPFLICQDAVMSLETPATGYVCFLQLGMGGGAGENRNDPIPYNLQ
jgi:hypothetical protein